MRMNRSRLLLAAALAVAAHGAYADLQAGPAILKPRIALSGAFDDNIYLSASALVGSGILTASPGIGVWLANDRTQLVFDYQFDLIHYNHSSGVNDAQHQNVGLQFEHAFTEDAWAALGDTFRVTTDPASSEQVERAIRNQNDASVNAELPLGSVLFVGLAGSHTVIDYHTQFYSDLLDRKEIAGGPRLGVSLSEKSRAYGYYRFNSVTYSNSQTGFFKDSTGGGAGLGLEGRLTPRTAIALETGLLMRTYTHTVTGDANTISTLGVNLKLTWTAPGDYVVYLAGGRMPQESLFTRFYFSNAGAVAVAKALGPQWGIEVSGSYGEDHYSADFPVFTGGLDAFGFPAFNLVRRLDRLGQAGLALTYQLYDNQRLRVKYLYRNRNSNLDVYDYKDNLVTVSADYRF